MRHLALILMLGLAICTQAADIYTDQDLSVNITDGTYSIAGRSGGGSDGDAYTTIAQGAAVLTAGDTLHVREGVYYEQVTVSSLAGTDGSRITIKNYGSETPEVSGSEAILNWTQSTSTETYLTVNGVTNTNYASIYWARVPESYFSANLWSTTIFEDGERLFIGSFPEQSESYGEDTSEFMEVGDDSNGVDTYIIDPNLTQADDYWNDAIIRIHLYRYNNNTVTAEVDDYTLSTTRLDLKETLPAVIQDGLVGSVQKQDHYRILNHPMLVDAAGKFYISAVESYLGTDYRRVYVWPNDAGDLTDLMRIPSRSYTFRGATSNDMWLVIDGFKCWGTTSHGISFDGASGGHGGQLEIKNCEALHTLGTGILINTFDDVNVVDCNAYYSGNRGIMGITVENMTIEGGEAGDTYSTNISFYNAIESRIIYSECFGARGGHGNGISTYGNISGPWINRVLVAGNLMHNCNISQNYAMNYTAFGNVFDHTADTDLEQQALTAFASSYAGYIAVMHNTAPRCLRTAFELVEEGSIGDDPNYYVANNIFDGMSWSWQDVAQTDWKVALDPSIVTVQLAEYNAFTRYEWTQAASRGWYGNTGDVDLTAETLDDIFADPTYLTGDWRPETGGPIDGTGRTVYATLVSLGVVADHPQYNFTEDLTGAQWGSIISIGAYAGSGTATGSVPVITSNGGGATAAISVEENQTAVTQVAATGTATIVYSITGGADQSEFTINTSNGTVAFASAPDYETPGDSDLDNDYIVEVTASNGYGNDAQTITVTVTDVLTEGSGVTYLLASNWETWQ